MGLGEATIVTLEYLDSLKDDKACPVCYHAYLRKFLSKKDRWCLIQTSWDCGCDYGGQVPTSFHKKPPRFSVADLHAMNKTTQ